MPEQPSWTNKEIGLLNTVLVLAQWDKRLPRYIAKLFGDPDQYANALEKIREGLAQAEREQVPPMPTPGATLTGEEWESLYLGIARAAPLRNLFKSDTDPFAAITPDQLLVMAGISDVTPDPRTMFYTRDDAFMAVLAAMRESSTPDTNRFIRDGLERFLYLAEAGDKVVEMLNDLARSSDWQVVLASLRDRRTYTEEGSSAATSLGKWNGFLTDDLRLRIFSPNYLSRVPQELVRLACDGRSLFVDAGEKVAPEVSDPTGRRVQQARIAFELFERDFAERLNRVKANIRLRFDVAQHLADVRRFAKMDAFVDTWPKVASVARARYKSWEYVEDCFVRHLPRPSDADLDAVGARELYDLCATDQQLLSFLDLKPHFGEIDENLFIGYKPMASVSLESSTIADATLPISPPGPSPASAQAPTISTAPSLNVVIVQIEPAAPAEGDLPKLQLKLSVQLQQGDPFEGTTAIPIAIPELIDAMLKTIGSSSPDNLRAFLKDFSSRSGNEPKLLLDRAGTLLFDTLFTPRMRSEFIRALEGDQKVRVLIQTDIEDIAYLPWEWLPAPGQGDSLVRLPRFSLIRAPLEPRMTSLSPLAFPLPMVVMMRPVSSYDLETSVAALERVLPWDKTRAKFLVDRNAIVENLKDELKSVRPQILHFEGNVSDMPEFHLKGFADDLLASGLQLVVFGNNSVSAFHQNPNAAVAAALVRNGLPAVLTANRGVDDVTASNFVSEFYQSFLNGATLEQATSDARAKVSRRGGDWSAFALFANPSVLNFFSPLSSAS